MFSCIFLQIKFLKILLVKSLFKYFNNTSLIGSWLARSAVEFQADFFICSNFFLKDAARYFLFLTDLHWNLAQIFLLILCLHYIIFIYLVLCLNARLWVESWSGRRFRAQYLLHNRISFLIWSVFFYNNSKKENYFLVYYSLLLMLGHLLLSCRSKEKKWKIVVCTLTLPLIILGSSALYSSFTVPIFNN